MSGAGSRPAKEIPTCDTTCPSQFAEASHSTPAAQNRIREVALPLGFVDVKVCAVSEVWSGLKLVVRKELRGRRST